MTPDLTPASQAAGQTDIITWYLFIAILILSTVLIYIILMTTSKPVRDWHHSSLVQKPAAYGPLHDLALSFHRMTPSYADAEPTRALIRHKFYEKITSTRHLTEEQRQQLYQNDPALLQQLIKDPELIAWLAKKPPQHTTRWSSRQTREQTREEAAASLSRILDKMETWT